MVYARRLPIIGNDFQCVFTLLKKNSPPTRSSPWLPWQMEKLRPQEHKWFGMEVPQNTGLSVSLTQPQSRLKLKPRFLDSACLLHRRLPDHVPHLQHLSSSSSFGSTWEIPWTEEPGRLESTGLQRVRHDGVAEHSHKLWQTVWRFLNELKIELPYDPATPLLGIYCRQKSKITNLERYTYPNIHTSTIYGC